jgi:hypothetical protein
MVPHDGSKSLWIPPWTFVCHRRLVLINPPVQRSPRRPASLEYGRQQWVRQRSVANPESRRPPECPLSVSAIGRSRPGAAFRRNSADLAVAEQLGRTIAVRRHLSEPERGLTDELS